MTRLVGNSVVDTVHLLLLLDMFANLCLVVLLVGGLEESFWYLMLALTLQES